MNVLMNRNMASQIHIEESDITVNELFKAALWFTSLTDEQFQFITGTYDSPISISQLVAHYRSWS